MTFPATKQKTVLCTMLHRAVVVLVYSQNTPGVVYLYEQRTSLQIQWLQDTDQFDAAVAAAREMDAQVKRDIYDQHLLQVSHRSPVCPTFDSRVFECSGSSRSTFDTGDLLIATMGVPQNIVHIRRPASSRCTQDKTSTDDVEQRCTTELRGRTG